MTFPLCPKALIDCCNSDQNWLTSTCSIFILLWPSRGSSTSRWIPCLCLLVYSVSPLLRVSVLIWLWTSTWVCIHLNMTFPLCPKALIDCCNSIYLMDEYFQYSSCYDLRTRSSISRWIPLIVSIWLVSISSGLVWLFCFRGYLRYLHSFQYDILAFSYYFADCIHLNMTFRPVVVLK